MRAAVPAFLVDAGFVLLFAVLGLLSHGEDLGWGPVLRVGWPFLVALGLGWALAVASGPLPTGVPGSPRLWVVTAVVGLVVRAATDGGFAWPFALVAVLVLGAFLVGWRCAVEVVRFAGAALARWSESAARRPR